MKLLGMLLAGLALSNGAKEQCVDLCPDSPAYEAFGGYLEGLSNCEKRELLPTMTDRYNYMLRSEQFFQDDPNVDNPMEAEKSLGEVYVIHRKELLLLETEFKKTQSMLFADCISAESLKILAKHISILSHAIEEHKETIAYLEEQMN